MSIEDLLERYFGEITVEDTNFIPSDRGGCPDIALLTLMVPKQFLYDCPSKKRRNNFPNDFPEQKFLKEMKLLERLRDSDKYRGQGHEPLLDILEYLVGAKGIQLEYQELNDGRVRMMIMDLPESYEVDSKG